MASWCLGIWGIELMPQFVEILACILSPQHTVMQKHWLVFKQLVYVTANIYQK